MRTRIIVLSIAAALLSSICANAQKFSIEVSTGYPFPMMTHRDAGPEPGSPEAAEADQMFLNGQSRQITFLPNLNVVCSYHFDPRAEVSLFLNLHGYSYRIVQHPKGGDPSMGIGWPYDETKVEKVLNRGYKNMAVAPGVLFKYYWYNREVWKWYSALGASYLFTEDPVWYQYRVIPQITFIGTHFGRGRWYGVADLSLGPMGLGPQVGCGYQL
jgi:hypothetical protein